MQSGWLEQFMENLNFDELGKDKAYEFIYIFNPMPLKGATGSAGSPIAVT